ncbi:cytochrome P450 [Actinomadura sp. NPDC023710]|uniref:cytochrome P450 n=1 Tax=Actinomadura sp. NPDC023710 TaxID=3158219 RepID=UPI0033EB9581
MAEGLVEELLRHDTPAAYGLPRVATEDVDLPSGTVRKGETVLPLLARANRDPEVFPEPAAFDPKRPPPPALRTSAWAPDSRASKSPQR